MNGPSMDDGTKSFDLESSYADYHQSSERA